MFCLAMAVQKCERDDMHVGLYIFETLHCAFASILAQLINAMRSPTSLADCREQLARELFVSILTPTNCSHHLLSCKRDINATAELRYTNQ